MIVHAHLACVATAQASVRCAVVVDADRDAVWTRVIDGRVTITSELPFGATPAVSLELAPESPDGVRYVSDRDFARGDFLPCAVTTIRAELTGVEGAIWHGAITWRTAGCAHPRVRPRVSCDRAMQATESLTFGSPEPEPMPVIACSISLDRAPPMPLRLFAQLGDAPADVGDFAGREASVDEPDHDTPFAAIRLAITTPDGAILWRGTGR
jgi:hypothetical protein